jgi:putative membrane protein
MTPADMPDPRAPLNPRDFSRRTLLANERTFLAWWRTGLTALTAGIAAAQIVPQLSDSEHQWPYTLVGMALCAIGTLCIVYGQWRRIAVDRAIRSGDFAEPSALVTTVITAAGALIGIGLLVVIAVTA